MSSFLSASKILLIYIYIPVRPFLALFSSDGIFREHLSRALPTEMIFYLLRGIPLECFLPDNFADLLDMLEVIVKWLQVSVGECNRRIPQTKKFICV